MANVLPDILPTVGEYWVSGMRFLTFTTLGRVTHNYYDMTLKYCYQKSHHSFKIFPCFWIIHHNQQLLTKFWKSFVLLNQWHLKFCHIEPMMSEVQPAADCWTIDQENLGMRLCSFLVSRKTVKWQNFFKSGEIFWMNHFSQGG